MNQKFKTGDKVYHDVYGYGVIKEIIPDYTGDVRYEVGFSRYPRQTLSIMGDNSMHIDNKTVSKKKNKAKGENTPVYFSKKEVEEMQKYIEDFVKAGGKETEFAKILSDGLNSVRVLGGIADSEESEKKSSVADRGGITGPCYIFADGKETPKKSNNDTNDGSITCGDLTPKANEISRPKIDTVKMHKDIVLGLNELYAKKNADYGDSFHDTYLEEGMAMARIRLSDKLSRFKSLTKGGSQQVSDESIRDTLLDLANYAIMTVIEMDREAGAKVGA